MKSPSVVFSLLTVLTYSLFSAAQNYELKTTDMDSRCLQAKSIVKTVLDRLPTAGELVVVVCTDRDFDGLAERYGIVHGNAFSLEMRDGQWLMLFRAGAILGETRWNPGFTPTHIIVHEYGHIKTHSHDEGVAENWASHYF